MGSQGKALGVPVYELLGGMNRNHVECYTTTFRGGGNTLRERAAAHGGRWRLFRFDASLPPGSASYDARAHPAGAGRLPCRAKASARAGNFMVDFHNASPCRCTPRLHAHRRV